MTRQTELLKAWDDWHAGMEPDEIPAPVNPAFNRGFNAGWEALMEEISTVTRNAEAEWHANGLETICSLDCLIDMRLRERAREE